jgi:CRP/FNR family transcriptional regulator, anaerobic regulatory protein
LPAAARSGKLELTLNPLEMTMAAAMPVASIHTLDSAAHPPWIARRASWPAETLQTGVAALVELLGGTPDAACTSASERFLIHRVARGQALVHEGAHADMLYAVHSGSFKCVKTAEDGYEHVLAFASRRDVIGYDGLASAHYAFSAIALEDSRVVALPLAGLDALRRRAPPLDAALQTIIAAQLAHAGEIAEVMAAVSADVRLARFLSQLSARMAARGQSPRRLLLRMNRRDIASHLGLAHETISRSFRVLVERGWLCVDNREIEITDLAGLRQFAHSTRGAADEAMHHEHVSLADGPWAAGNGSALSRAAS